MTDNANVPNNTGTPPANQGDGANARTFTQAELDNLIAQRLERERGKYADYDKLKTDAQEWQRYQDAQKSEMDKLKEQVEQLKGFKGEAERNKAALAATLAKRLEAVPEQMRSLIPAYDDPAKVLEYLETNAALLSNRKAPPMDPGAGGANGGGGAQDKALTPSRADMAMAANMRVPIADYMKQKAAMERERSQPRTDLDIELGG